MYGWWERNSKVIINVVWTILLVMFVSVPYLDSNMKWVWTPVIEGENNNESKKTNATETVAMRVLDENPNRGETETSVKGLQECIGHERARKRY